MDSIPVIIKHQGKRHEVELDPTATGEILKYQLFSLTGVEPERQKILIKGGQLKDDTELSTLGAKPGQTFMMLGTPSSGTATTELGKPKEKMKFVEDMTEAEAAKADGATPAGLQNLGNTCYMNSTLQALKSVPELQEELLKYTPSSNMGGSSSGLGALSQLGLGALGAQTDLTASLRDLFKTMSETQTGFPPIMFLNALRTAYPQFAQRSKTGHGYAQQDAEEAWTQILSQLRQKLKIKDTPSESSEQQQEISFIDKYLAGKFDSVLECDELEAKEAEEPIKSTDAFLKLDCHINKDINHLSDGIKAGLEEKIEKHSPTLNRDAIYTKRSQISRLPKYLTVHFVRFFWKREAQKKAKIMRKVTFPSELDVVEFCTDELQKQLVPVRNKVRDVRKEEQDVERARKRLKLAHKQEEDRKTDEASGVTTEPMQKKTAAEEHKQGPSKSTEGKAEDTPMPDAVYKTDAEYDAERAASIQAAKKELFALIDPQLAADEGANKSGLYELRGVITHQGASADSGHYTSYVKKTGKLVDDGKGGKMKEQDDKWWWFNDEKVTEVEAEKIETLAGGGESHSALILLYRAIDLPTAEEIKE